MQTVGKSKSFEPGAPGRLRIFMACLGIAGSDQLPQVFLQGCVQSLLTVLCVKTVQGSHSTNGIRIQTQPQLYFAPERGLTPQDALKQEAAAAKDMFGQLVPIDSTLFEPEQFPQSGVPFPPKLFHQYLVMFGAAALV